MAAMSSFRMHRSHPKVSGVKPWSRHGPREEPELGASGCMCPVLCNTDLYDFLESPFLNEVVKLIKKTGSHLTTCTGWASISWKGSPLSGTRSLQSTVDFEGPLCSHQAVFLTTLEPSPKP